MSRSAAALSKSIASDSSSSPMRSLGSRPNLLLVCARIRNCSPATKFAERTDARLLAAFHRHGDVGRASHLPLEDEGKIFFGEFMRRDLVLFRVGAHDEAWAYKRGLNYIAHEDQGFDDGLALRAPEHFTGGWLSSILYNLQNLFDEDLRQHPCRKPIHKVYARG